MDQRDIRLLQCYLGPVSTKIFDGVFADYARSVFPGELERDGISRKYHIFYSTGKMKDDVNGKNYDRNVAYIYTEDYRFSYRLAGHNDSGEEAYREVFMDHLDNERDYSVFEEIFGIGADSIAFTGTDDSSLKERIVLSRERAFPANPKDYIVPESERISYPPTSSGFIDGTFDFVIKTAKLTTAARHEDRNKVEFTSTEAAQIGCMFSTTVEHPIVSGKTVVYKDEMDACRAVTAMGKAKLAKYAGRGGATSNGSAANGKGSYPKRDNYKPSESGGNFKTSGDNLKRSSSNIRVSGSTTAENSGGWSSVGGGAGSRKPTSGYKPRK